MRSFLLFWVTAACEIAGCYAIWSWARLGRSWLWMIPGMLSLWGFGWLLTQVDSPLAGRTYAAYGGIYIVSSILWLLLAENVVPDRWDMIGAALCLAGTCIILYAPR